MEKVIKVFVYPASRQVLFSSKRLSRIYGGNPDQDNCVLFVKGKPKITLNPGKTSYNNSQGSVSSAGSPAGESKPQRYFFQFNRESEDVSDAVGCVRRKECACESKCPGEAGDGQHQWKTMGHLFSPQCKMLFIPSHLDEPQHYPAVMNSSSLYYSTSSPNLELPLYYFNHP